MNASLLFLVVPISKMVSSCRTIVRHPIIPCYGHGFRGRSTSKMTVLLFLGCALVALIGMGCQKQKETTLIEPFRSAFHFTPPSGWMNDPNGMFYYQNEYHLFYQHYPDSTVWGPMHWGHAVSTDLMHWQHLPIALYPDSMGYIFSGSAVVDWNNTSGFGTPGNPPIVAIFTYHNMAGEQAGRIDFQTQGIAFSLDKGRTWMKYPLNPVIKNPGIKDFRDPKVTWHEAAKQWILTLAVKDHIEFYGSPNLKAWTKLSEFGQTLGAHGGVWECPDLFPMVDAGNKLHWVLLVSINPGGPQGGSATQYFVGDFDGEHFTPYDSVIRWIDFGADNYAGVTWSDVPATDGRRLFMGWMSNWQYAQVVPTQTWRSAMTLPRQLTLVNVDNALWLHSAPAREVDQYFTDENCFTAQADMDGPSRININITTKESSMTLFNTAGDSLLISWKPGTVAVDRRQAGLQDFHPAFPAVHTMPIGNPLVTALTIYVDNSSVEVFVNQGAHVMTELVFPRASFTKIKTDVNQKFCLASVSR
jgi:fructan beta-fructosidase